MTHPDAQRAFEEKYQRSAQDPASAEMLSIWNEAWDAATERAAKVCDEHAANLTSIGFRGRETAEECATAIRGTK